MFKMLHIWCDLLLNGDKAYLDKKTILKYLVK
jgi:hypothetical protein